jgi:hydroxymethylpyrimidine kinase/phosphomethylpyrimidine kinase
MKRVLTIAGSDSGGGAGVQADLKTITLLGGYGMSVITAVTAQNTVSVQAIHAVPASIVEIQIDSVFSDIGADAVKTGMLVNSEIVEVVARKIKQYKVDKVVIDPVIVATSGVGLFNKADREMLVKQLIPFAMVITPNLMEASILTGFEVNSITAMKKAALRIYEMGAKYVVVKGGHLKGKPVDLLYDGKEYSEIEGGRVATKNTHGTGCVFASAIATFLAKGEQVFEAVERAKTFVTQTLQSSLDLGKGTGPADPSIYFLREVERCQVLQELRRAVDILKAEKIGHLIPEVSANLGYALSDAKSVEDVAAFPGRIIRLKDSVATCSDPEFGASRHIASIILTVMRFNPDFRSAMNIRYSKENIAILKSRGFLIDHFDRRLEPKKLKEKEGFSLEWGVGEVLKKMGGVPDFIYDEGDIGKEPMIRVLGKTPLEVVQKILKIF